MGPYALVSASISSTFFPGAEMESGHSCMDFSSIFYLNDRIFSQLYEISFVLILNILNSSIKNSDI